MVNKDFIGLDLGKARSGIARASVSAKLAEPMETVATEQLLTKLAELTKSQPIEAIVVGLPRGLDGQETDQTKWVRGWVDDLKKELSTPVYGQDEALTTKMAEARRFAGKGLHDPDAIAAAIILQDFLDSSEAERVLL